MLSNLMWIVTAASLVGVVMNIKKLRVCFFIWLFTNSLWCAYDFYIQAYAQSALFFVYVLLAIWGIIAWKDNPKSEEGEMVDDGLGSSCSAWCPQCHQKTMQIIRPGDIRCADCG